MIDVIFLDIDGVLNYAMCKARAPSGCLGISDSKMKLLKSVLNDTGAKVVLTSTWKKEWSPALGYASADGEYMLKKFRKEGIFIIDKTKEQNLTHRGEGINAWLNSHDVNHWAVVDDDFFDDFKQYGIEEHLVQTDFVNGLTEEHVSKIKQLLLPA